VTATMTRDSIKDINKFLKGTHMGIDAIAALKKQSENNGIDELSMTLTEILEMYKNHQAILENIIKELGGKPVKNSGVIGEIVGFFDDIKDYLLLNNKEAILKEAIKNVDTGYNMGNKFLEINLELDKKTKSVISTMVEDNKKALQKLREINIR